MLIMERSLLDVNITGMLTLTGMFADPPTNLVS